jgi:hypothetical protein
MFRNKQYKHGQVFRLFCAVIVDLAQIMIERKQYVVCLHEDRACGKLTEVMFSGYWQIYSINNTTLLNVKFKNYILQLPQKPYTVEIPNLIVK